MPPGPRCPPVPLAIEGFTLPPPSQGRRVLDLAELEGLLADWSLGTDRGAATGNQAELMSSSESEWKTPSPSPKRSTKRKRDPLVTRNDEEVKESASPDLERKEKIMKRTPQPQLTQSRLTGTGMLQLSGQPPTKSRLDPPVPASPGLEQGTATVTDDHDMDTSEGAPDANPTQGKSTLVTTDFLLRALKENTDFLLKSFNSNLGALTKRVEDNSSRIDATQTATQVNGKAIEAHGLDISSLRDRVSALEKSGASAPGGTTVATVRASLSPDYMLARRSLRLWPIVGSSIQDIWGGVGDFIHDLLKISTADAGQDDIEDIHRPTQQGGGAVNNEVVVVFRDKKIRDLIMSGTVNLASAVDGAGKPTAGVRLEIPKELDDTFRLLARFGTRLRARHGPGTKRHVKFDDFAGSLYTNVKLPGDNEWTRVSPQMAASDLENSMKEENTMNQRRLASKLLPGPRERLSRPMAPISQDARGNDTTSPPRGKRPRWHGPPGSNR